MLVKRKLVGFQDKSALDKYDYLVFDMNHLAWRILKAVSLRTGGENTSLYYVGLRTLYQVFSATKPKSALLCWDGSHAWRKEVYTRYKANRGEVDPEIYESIHSFYSLMDLLGFPQARTKNFEGDDWVAWATAKAEGNTLFVSGDQDLFQLITNGSKLVHGYYPGKDTERVVVDAKIAGERFIAPELVSSYKSLAGDSSDNVLGVRGVGDKGARTLLESFGHVEDWLFAVQNKDTSVVPEQYREAGRPAELVFSAEGWQQARLCYDIVDLSEDHGYDYGYDLYAGREFLKGESNLQEAKDFLHSRGLSKVTSYVEGLYEYAKGLGEWQR